MKNNNKGMAILFVMTSIAILTAILAEFVFDTELNKTKVYNSQDKLQARLNAEAGLKFAMARLELYQEARNFLETNKSVKDAIRVEDLNTIWNIPFFYPIPQNSNFSAGIKLAIKEFMDKSLLTGEISTEIRNASNLININLLRIGKPKQLINSQQNNNSQNPNEDQDDLDRDDDETNTQADTNKNAVLNLEKFLTNLFTDVFNRKVESDDSFDDRYGNIEPFMLIKEIKFFINDRQRELEPEVQEVRAQYSSKDIQAKHAPFESISELYMLDGWDDALIDLIKDQITVHGVVVIDLNEIDETGLRLLIPEIDEIGIKDFFEYRDDPKAPRKFNNVDEFTNYIVNTAAILEKSEMEERLQQFREAGIEFGVVGSLFRVISKGSFGRANYTIDAFVEIPIKPTAPIVQNNQNQQEQDPNIDQENQPQQNPQQNPQQTNQNAQQNQPTQYLKPRVVEITIY